MVVIVNDSGYVNVHPDRTAKYFTDARSVGPGSPLSSCALWYTPLYKTSIHPIYTARCIERGHQRYTGLYTGSIQTIIQGLYRSIQSLYRIYTALLYRIYTARDFHGARPANQRLRTYTAFIQPYTDIHDVNCLCTYVAKKTSRARPMSSPRTPGLL
jgi:hypothetical protein